MVRTTCTSDTLPEHVRFENRRLEAMDGIQRNFSYPWAAVAEHNADYRTFVQAEELRMGADHPPFRTQYLLEPLASAGRLFSIQLSQMENTRAYSARPAMVPPGADVLPSERQPTQSLGSESTRNTTVAQPMLSRLEGGGPRDSITHPFSLPAVSMRGSGNRLSSAVNSGRLRVRSPPPPVPCRATSIGYRREMAMQAVVFL